MSCGRDLLIYKSIIYKGKYTDIYNSITKRELHDMDEVRRVVSQVKCSVVTALDADYPKYLLKYQFPPLVLFYLGDLSLLSDPENTIGVVGSRNPSLYGKNVTKELVSDLAKDFVIVSGLAKGIDGIAHEACLDVEGKTIAVLGGGVDICYPLTNLPLYEKIKEKGLLISEYPENENPSPENFPVRNRLISYFSKGLLIPEAKSRSGTLITVSWSSGLTKEIMCIPHEINKDSLCNRLIKEGAHLVESAEDVRFILESSLSVKKS